MKIGFLITARLKSSRLRLKLLHRLAGETVIKHVINRAKAVLEPENIVLCTSEKPQDFPLVKIAREEDIFYYNGSDVDVLARLNEATHFFGFDYVLCITADNPLFSVFHGSLLIDEIRSNPAIDFITTTGMPIGVNIYAIKAKALSVICKVKQEIDTEIWGPLVHKDIFNVKELPVDKSFKCEAVSRMTLDESCDLKLLQEIYNSVPGPVVDILDVYQLLQQKPELAQTNKKIVQRAQSNEFIERVNTYYKQNFEEVLSIKNSVYNEN